MHIMAKTLKKKGNDFMKDDRGEPVFSGETVDKMLKDSIIEHASEHAQINTSKPEAEPKSPESKPEKTCCKDINKKSILKIIMLAAVGIVTVACFLLVGNFYFIKKGKKKKR
jgi:hypothetical protein